MPAANSTWSPPLLDFLRRRLFFVVTVGTVVLAALIIWRVTAKVGELENRPPPPGIEPLVRNTFLGVPVVDNTHDKFMQNAWLRLAMNEGLRASHSVRKYQMGRIFLQDGQHPEDGQPAVIVVVEPKLHELPTPPYETVAVRRWRPAPKEVYSDERLRELQLSRMPHEDDLAVLRESWSGGRYAEFDSLFASFPWMFAALILGGALILIAGAFRTQSWWSTRWDQGADAAHEAGALSGLRSARDRKQQNDRLDMS